MSVNSPASRAAGRGPQRGWSQAVPFSDPVVCRWVRAMSRRACSAARAQTSSATLDPASVPRSVSVGPPSRSRVSRSSFMAPRRWARASICGSPVSNESLNFSGSPRRAVAHMRRLCRCRVLPTDAGWVGQVGRVRRLASLIALRTVSATTIDGAARPQIVSFQIFTQLAAFPRRCKRVAWGRPCRRLRSSPGRPPSSPVRWGRRADEAHGDRIGGGGDARLPRLDRGPRGGGDLAARPSGARRVDAGRAEALRL